MIAPFLPLFCETKYARMLFSSSTKSIPRWSPNNRVSHWDTGAGKDELSTNKRSFANISYSSQFSVTNPNVRVRKIPFRHHCVPVPFLPRPPPPTPFLPRPRCSSLAFMRVPCICLFTCILIWGGENHRGANTAAPLRNRINIHNPHSPLNVAIRFSGRIMSCRDYHARRTEL